MPYWLQTTFWIVGVFIAAFVVVGGFEFALEKWFELAFENNENLATIAIISIIALYYLNGLKNIIKSYRTDKRYREKVKDELKLLAIAIPVGILIVVIICWFVFHFKN